MLKKIIVLLLLAFTICNLVLATELKRNLAIIESLPEAKALMNEVHKQGSFGFEENNKQLAAQFGAYWDFGNRVVCVSPGKASEQGEMIAAIIFELHNAVVTNQWNALFDKAERREISKQDYILAVETLEYQNSKKAAAMVEKGIARGIFPQSAKLFTYNSFNEHYHYQQKGGHSAAIGKMYDDNFKN